MAQLKSTEDFLKEAGVAPIKSEDLQAKFDAVTKAEYDKQRTELQNTENKFYNKLYDTQQTTMDTIRQANAQAVATGASRGVQAANELSALLGLQQESVEGATDIANQATTLAQDETQAMLENVLNADTQAQEANQALANILMQRESVGVEQQNANTAAIQALGTLEAQARADGNVVLADFYKKTIEQLQTGSIVDGVATSTTGSDTPTNTPTTTPPVTDTVYSKFGKTNTDGTFTTNSGITGKLDTATDTITNDTGRYDLNGNLQAYTYTSTADLYAKLNNAGISTGQQQVLDSNLDQSQWGGLIDQTDFDEDTSKGKAGTYVNKIISDAKAGKIKVGQYVQFNYGDQNIFGGANYTYVYIGDGRFAKCIYAHDTDDARQFYVPEGYAVEPLSSKHQSAGARVPTVYKK